jgi:hypothetical protein
MENAGDPFDETYLENLIAVWKKLACGDGGSR